MFVNISQKIINESKNNTVRNVVVNSKQAHVLYFSVTQNLQFSIGVVAQGQEEAMVETN